jgi:hypothetical protein
MADDLDAMLDELILEEKSQMQEPAHVEEDNLDTLLGEIIVFIWLVGLFTCSTFFFFLFFFFEKTCVAWLPWVYCDCKPLL